MGKYRKRKKFKRITLIYWTLLLIMIMALVVTLPDYLMKIMEKYEEKDKLAEEITELTEQKEELEKEVAQLGDSDYVAKIARQKYLFSKSGETIIKIMEEENVEKEQSIANNSSERFVAIFLAIILLYLIISKMIKARKK